MVDTAKMTLADDALQGKWCCIINPNTNKNIGYWDAVTAVALLYTAVMTPYEVGFMQPAENWYDPIFLINRLLDVIFIVDMAVSSLLMCESSHRPTHNPCQRSQTATRP